MTIWCIRLLTKMLKAGWNCHFLIWLAAITQLTELRNNVFIIPSGNEVGFYQVQYQYEPLNTKNFQQNELRLVALHVRYMVTFCVHFLTRLSGNVDQTFCHQATQDYRLPNSLSSGSIRLLLNRAPLFTQFWKFTQLFIGKLKADSVTNQTLKANTELPFPYWFLSSFRTVLTKAENFANSQ